MSVGMFIAGSVMLTLAAASFNEGGVWNITGVLCSLAWIIIAVYFYKADQIS